MGPLHKHAALQQEAQYAYEIVVIQGFLCNAQNILRCNKTPENSAA
jgi:hypothetical protein